MHVYMWSYNVSFPRMICTGNKSYMKVIKCDLKSFNRTDKYLSAEFEPVRDIPTFFVSF